MCAFQYGIHHIQGMTAQYFGYYYFQRTFFVVDFCCILTSVIEMSHEDYSMEKVVAKIVTSFTCTSSVRVIAINITLKENINNRINKTIIK